MARKIPMIRAQFEVYVDGGTALMGVAEVTMPNFESMTETVTGAGIMGEIEVIATGQFTAGTTTLNFRLLYDDTSKFVNGKAYRFDLRSAIEVEDGTTYDKGVVTERWSITGQVKTITPGTMKAAGVSDASIEIANRRIQHWINGVETLEFDPLNNIYRKNGQDVYAAIRAAVS